MEKRSFIPAVSCFRLSTLTLSCVIGFSSLASAAVHTNTVDLSNTTLADGDVINISNQATGLQSLVSGQDALALGNGKIDLTLISDANSHLIIGAALSNDLSNDFGIGSTIKVDTLASTIKYPFTSYGIELSGSSGVKASQLGLSVSAQGAAYGIHSQSGGSAAQNLIDLGNGSSISVRSVEGFAHGIYMQQKGELQANALNIYVSLDAMKDSSSELSAITFENGGRINLGADSKLVLESVNQAPSGALPSYALKLYNGGDVTADRLTINTINGGGIFADGDANIDLGSGSSISVNNKGQNSNTFAIEIANALAKLTANRLNVNAVSHAVIVNGGSLNLTDSAISSTEGDALRISNGAAVTLDNVTLTSIEHTIWADSGSEVTLNDGLINGGLVISDSKLSANGLTLVYHGSNTSAAIEAAHNSLVTLTGDTVIDASKSTAITAINATVSGTGKMTILGDLSSYSGGDIDLNMTAGSLLHGSSKFTGASKISLTMDDSHWLINGGASLTDLTLHNSSVVEFDPTYSNFNLGWLSVDNLAGNGKFILYSDIGSLESYFILVNQSTAGSHQLKVVNNGASATDGSEIMTVVATADGGGQFSLSEAVEAGGYQYALRKNGNDWELYSTGVISRPADASANFLNAGYLMGYAENQTLRQRMGDLRQGKGGGNVWLRSYYGNFDSLSGEKLSGFSMSYRGFQLGADKGTVGASGQFYHGAFVGVVDANPRYSTGDGSLKSQSVGVYGSYMFNNGSYLDATLKYNRYRNQLSITDSQGNGINGKGDSNGISASIEGGRRFYLRESHTGVYAEPQLQLSYTRQGKTDIANSNGLHVGLKSYNSLLGRTGLLLGYQSEVSSRTPVNFFIKSGWQREFMGNTGFTLNVAQEKYSFKGDAWVSGVGVSTQLNNKHTVFLDMEKTNGSRFNQNQINAGYRFTF
jgi:outer membrane autotransporter protein